MATLPRTDQSAIHDGRITNGGKGVAYLRDYYLPTVLAEQMAARTPEVVAGS